MDQKEKQVIRAFAAGYVGLRDQAIRIHRKYVGSDRESLEQLFMREVDNPSPDLGLRAKFRRELLNNNKEGGLSHDIR